MRAERISIFLFSFLACSIIFCESIISLDEHLLECNSNECESGYISINKGVAIYEIDNDFDGITDHCSLYGGVGIAGPEVIRFVSLTTPKSYRIDKIIVQKIFGFGWHYFILLNGFDEFGTCHGGARIYTSDVKDNNMGLDARYFKVIFEN